LLTHAQGSRDSMDLLDFAETSGDEHAAVRLPVQESRLPRLLVTLEPGGHRGIERRNAFEN
jgi:hypothetical protein